MSFYNMFPIILTSTNINLLFKDSFTLFNEFLPLEIHASVKNKNKTKLCWIPVFIPLTPRKLTNTFCIQPFSAQHISTIMTLANSWTKYLYSLSYCPLIVVLELNEGIYTSTVYLTGSWCPRYTIYVFL